MIDYDLNELFGIFLETGPENYERLARTHQRLGQHKSLLAFDYDYPTDGRRAILDPVRLWLRQAKIGCSKPILFLQGERGLGKTHIASGVVQWQILNRGFPFKWIYWPEVKPIRDEDDDKLFKSPLLVLEDIDTGMDISATSGSPWQLELLLAILRPRIEKQLTFPTIIIANQTLDDMEQNFSRDTSGADVPQAKRLAQTLINLIKGASISAAFRGNSYRLKLGTNWREQAIARANQTTPEELGLKGKF